MIWATYREGTGGGVQEVRGAELTLNSCRGRGHGAPATRARPPTSPASPRRSPALGQGTGMPTTNQLARKPVRKPRKRGKSLALQQRPQVRGGVLWAGIRTPRKPNSAQRTVARVRLSNGIEVT